MTMWTRILRWRTRSPPYPLVISRTVPSNASYLRQASKAAAVLMTTAAAALTAPTGDFSRTFSPTLTMPLHTISSSCDAADKEPSRERAARLFRKRTTLQVATAASDQNNSHSSQDLSSSHNKTPQKGAGTIQRFDTQEELSKLRAKEKEMMQRWEKDEDGWRELPARAWPAYQPNPEQLKGILAEITILHCDLHAKDDLSNYPNGGVSDDVKLCTDLLFDMATAFVFYNINPKAGLAQYEQLAERGHVDSMVASGIILVEGLGVPPREQEGLAWLEEAVQKGSAQAYYELGTVYYTGIDGVVEEDAEKAFRLFERAAEQDHTAALYMVADCLAEGEGTEKSVARAIPLFYKAAERGHRFSRQRIRELLARLDYPF